MTGSTLAIPAASLLSLLFSYIPGFKTWYQPKPSDAKHLIVLALVFVVYLVAFSFACVGLADDFAVKISCDAFGSLDCASAFFRFNRQRSLPAHRSHGLAAM